MDICPPIIFVEKNKASGKKPAQEFHLFILIILRFVKSSDNEIKKLVANAVPQRTKKSTKYAVNVFEGEESYE